MLIGDRAGQAYVDDMGRFVYETRDGEGAYRTNQSGEGLWCWSDRQGGWKQLYGTAQFQPESLEEFEKIMRHWETL